jgi:hypothetical protein
MALEVLSQSFYLQHSITGLAVTQTLQGITTKQILASTITDQVWLQWLPITMPFYCCLYCRAGVTCYSFFMSKIASGLSCAWDAEHDQDSSVISVCVHTHYYSCPRINVIGLVCDDMMHHQRS